MQEYLEPTFYIDSDHPAVIEYTRKALKNVPENDPIQQAITLYYQVRDDFRYDAYNVELSREALKASHLVSRDHGYCIEKAILLAACARVVGIPSRLGFANVRNHIATEKLERLLKTNVMVFHGYTELYLQDKWVKATPAFNEELCERLKVAPLEFDGKEDSIFQEYDRGGQQHMEYLHDYGRFADMPFELYISSLQKEYSHIFENPQALRNLGWNYASQA